MQIHELNTFVGAPSATDYLAIDDGSETNKVPATALGVSTQMTQAEAEAGTVTDPRVISPSVFKAAVTSLATNIANTLISALSSVYVSITDPKYVLDVTINASTGYATAGEDMDLYNALVDLGWVSDVIETE